MRRWGYRPELLPPDPDRLFAPMRAWRGVLPTALSLMVDVDPEIYEQGFTGSCVAQAAAAGARMVMVLHGNGREADVASPSRRWIYREARATHGDQNEDAGTYGSAALHVMRVQGWPAEHHMPWSDLASMDPDDARRDAWICGPPTVTARHHAIDQAGAISEHGLIETGDELEDAIKRSLVAGYPLLCGGLVTRDWQELTDWWDVCDMRGSVAGGHAMLVVGYDEDGYHLRNSWGAGWGVGGLGRVTRRVVRDVLRDYHAITLVRKATT